MPGRGRPSTHEEMKEKLCEDGELDWHKTTILRKRTSVGHKLIWGRCYKKTVIYKITCSSSFGNYALERLYATPEEMFKHILEYGK